MRKLKGAHYSPSHRCDQGLTLYLIDRCFMTEAQKQTSVLLILCLHAALLELLDPTIYPSLPLLVRSDYLISYGWLWLAEKLRVVHAGSFIHYTNWPCVYVPPGLAAGTKTKPSNSLSRLTVSQMHAMKAIRVLFYLVLLMSTVALLSEYHYK